jgi:hypothetical protein
MKDIVRNVNKNTVLIRDFNLLEIDWERGVAPARYREFVETVEQADMA